ncbi:hypothetical protein [Abyssalbus ytuae]|uniref:Uncharacterized protein n=1 Tax=Abyssalbus ytuae TaxID=2926907 RepID=A0A9E6ZIV8_9FLAO|nr:hypothetical protein [Abyssalbus ytuae]UOB16367.1 hypothetical protein MQE35_11540 [Abyssalbus ytuae]
MKKFIKYFVLFFFLFLCISCTKELDFEQADSLELTPVLEASLIYFELNSEEIIEKVLLEFGLTEVPPTEILEEIFPDDLIIQLSDTVETAAFNDTFFVKNLTRADIFYQISNSTNIPYTAQVEFLNENNVLLHQSDFVITPATTENPSITEQTDSFVDENLNRIIQTTKMVVNMDVGVDLNFVTGPEGSLIFNSAGTFYFLIDAE